VEAVRGLIILAAMALSGCVGQKPCPPAPNPAEQAAVFMVRMGYDRWVVACAYAAAKDGRSFNEADQNCRVDFHLPPEREP
jgi:hypothetical protein